MNVATLAKINKTQTALWALLFILGFSAFLPHGLSYTASLLVLFLWLISPQQRRLHIQRLPSKQIMFLLAAFVLWPIFVTTYYGWFTDTTTRLFHVVRVALLLQMGLMCTTSERLAAFKGLIWGGLFTCLIIITHQITALPDWAIWRNLLEVQGSQSSRAMIMLAIASGICLAMWVKTKDGSKIQSLTWLASGILFAAVMATYSISRNAQIVLLSMPFILLIHHYRSWRGVLISAGGCAIFVLLSWNFFPNIPTRFSQAAIELEGFLGSGNCDSSVGVRFAMSKMAWNNLMTHPWMGTGIGSFVEYWMPLAKQNCPSAAGIRQPHNDFLLFAMEAGWMGLITTLAVIFWFLRISWNQSRVSGAVGLLLCVSLIITGFINSPMRDAGIGFVMIFLLAASNTLPNNIEKNILKNERNQ